MNKYQWLIKPPLSEEIKQQFPQLSPIILQLLIDRGLTSQTAIDEFLYPDYSQDIHDPYLFSQMTMAVARIYQARVKQEQVVIYGDYDADGVCGTVILAKVFKEIGVHYEVYLPDREFEGYGLNAKAIKQLAKQQVNLIITVDCGISNYQEVALAKDLGLEIIITDHHQAPKELPAALAIIHPGWDKNYPFKNLAGGGVAYKLAQAVLLDQRFKISEKQREIIEKWLLDLVAISTVADLVKLLGENRTLVKHGLIVLAKTKNLGLEKLMTATGINQERLDTYTIGWQIAPRINAAGRMSHANSAYQLLVTDNIEEAITIAHELNKRNQERQLLTEKLVEAAQNQLGQVADDLPVIFCWGENWSAGVIGLVASKLCNGYARPAIVLSKKGELLVASGRSIEEFNLIEALDRFREYFEKYGGHQGAAGFSIKTEKFESFKEQFINYAQEKLRGVKFLPRLFIDGELKLSAVDWPLIDALIQFEPFGEGNPRPKFLIKNLMVRSCETVGHEDKHLKIIVSQDNCQRKVIGFGFGSFCERIKPQDNIDLVVEVGVNEWNGSKEIQLSLVDLKLSKK